MNSKVFFTVIALEFLRQVKNILQCLLRLLVVLFELLIRDQCLRLLFHFPDGIKTNDYQQKVDYGVNHAEIDHVSTLLQDIHESIKAHVVKQDHKERVESADLMIRLVLLDVNLIVAHHK